MRNSYKECSISVAQTILYPELRTHLTFNSQFLNETLAETNFDDCVKYQAMQEALCMLHKYIRDNHCVSNPKMNCFYQQVQEVSLSMYNTGTFLMAYYNNIFNICNNGVLLNIGNQ